MKPAPEEIPWEIETALNEMPAISRPTEQLPLELEKAVEFLDCMGVPPPAAKRRSPCS